MAGAGHATGRIAESEPVPAMLQLAVVRSMARDAGPEYRIEADGYGTNPRHGLALAFTRRGVYVAGRDGEFALRLERFGRADGRPVRRAAPHIHGAWVEYDRGTGLREWFFNSPRGLEQGWTVSERPVGRGPLVLELDTARPPDRTGDDRLAWSELIYHGLTALDAEGRRLPSRWVLDGTRLRIEVDDGAARYPVLIDPWVIEEKLTASDGAAGDRFGASVAVSGDTAVVGADSAAVEGNAGQGAAYVFTRSGEIWSEEAKLVASDGAEGDRFGVSVAVSGDTAIVGAPFADVKGNADQGAVYVFTRTEGIWSEQAKLTASDGAGFAKFGTSVAVTGDTALVGAPPFLSAGAAYVFTRSVGVWGEQAKLTPSDGAGRDFFGVSVALSDDTALVGASIVSVNGNLFQGAAYVFTRTTGVWSEQAKLTASDGAESDNFGISVAVSGDTALVGALGADVNGNTDQGAAYVFTRTAGVWSEQAKLIASDGVTSRRFGNSVALSGDTALVGASFSDVNGNVRQGAAYVFTRTDGAWSELIQLIAFDGFEDDRFGISVALAAGTALVGANLADVDGIPDQGAVYVFAEGDGADRPFLYAEPRSLSATVDQGQTGVRTLTLNNLGNETLLWEVADEGDCALPGWVSVVPSSGTVPGDSSQEVDVTFDATGLDVGDFQADLCIGSNDPQRPLTAVPLVLTVKARDVLEGAKLTASDGVASELFGASVAISGDTALVGADGADVNGNVGQGAVYVFTRTEGVWSEQAKLIASDGAEHDFFGGSVALSGDIAIVGASQGDVNGNVDQGAVYVFTRTEGVWSEQAKLTASDGVASDLFGGSVALSGDTALVGARDAEVNGNGRQGAAYVFTRTAGVWSEQAKLIASDGAGDDLFGVSVAVSGDTALVGARADVNGNVNQGAAYIFTRTDGVWSEQAKLTASDGAENDRFGFSVALSSDTAQVGADGADVNGNANQGAAYFFTRTDGVWSEQAKLTASDGVVDDFFGSSVALSGDIALVGAGLADVDGNFDQGAAYVFTRTDGLWSEHAKLVASDGTESDRLGASVALADNAVLVGAPGADVDGNEGQGAAYFFVPDAILSVDPEHLSTTLPRGQTETLPLTLSNLGGLALEWGVTEEEEGCALPTWVAVDPLGGSVAGGESQEVDVTFDATALQPDDYAASLCLMSNDPEQPLTTLPLALTVTGVAELTFHPASLDFGATQVGSTSPPQTAMLQNSGDVDVTGIAFEVPVEEFTADTGGCGPSLDVGEECAVTVRFTPTEPGPAAATVTVTGDPSTTVSLELIGEGVSAGFTAMALEVDQEPQISDGNGLLEPGETVDVVPAWRNDGALPQSLAGTASGFTGPQGAGYTLVLEEADYGLLEPGQTADCQASGVCYRLRVSDPASRPAAHWDATFDETLSDFEETTETWTLHLGESFADVPAGSLFYEPIETLLHSGVTGGCSESAYCPAGANTRAQMAVFVLRALEGGGYAPPACVAGEERFLDVPAGGLFCPWIEELAGRGVTSGCGGGNYCPGDSVTRAQMAVFLLKAVEGEGYEPPECTGRFIDVSCPSLFADWIEDLAAREITSGCTAVAYCPADPVSRAQMAVFVTKAFGLALYGP